MYSAISDGLLSPVVTPQPSGNKHRFSHIEAPDPLMSHQAYSDMDVEQVPTIIIVAPPPNRLLQHTLLGEDADEVIGGNNCAVPISTDWTSQPTHCDYLSPEDQPMSSPSMCAMGSTSPSGSDHRYEAESRISISLSSDSSEKKRIYEGQSGLQVLSMLRRVVQRPDLVERLARHSTPDDEQKLLQEMEALSLEPTTSGSDGDVSAPHVQENIQDVQMVLETVRGN